MTLTIYLIRRKSNPKQYLSKQSKDERVWTENPKEIDVWTTLNGSTQATLYLKRASCPWANAIKFEDCEIIKKEIEI